ncbi:hypothetical protein GGD38_000704 [Chitinophagaceae bacterium OAS944]|nr:hypothetical protein [Chitinophagaceae bacterium OAS944]
MFPGVYVVFKKTLNYDLDQIKLRRNKGNILI